MQAAGGFSGGGNRPQASKPAKNGVSLYLTLGRAGKAFHQAVAANQEQSSHEQRRGAGLWLLPGGSDKPPRAGLKHCSAQKMSLESSGSGSCWLCSQLSVRGTAAPGAAGGASSPMALLGSWQRGKQKLAVRRETRLDSLLAAHPAVQHKLAVRPATAHEKTMPASHQITASM